MPFSAKQVLTAAQLNDLSIDTLTTTGNVTVGGTISGNGSGLTALNATLLSTGVVPSARLIGSYVGITEVGWLSSLTIGGTTTSSGTFTYSGSGTALVMGGSASPIRAEGIQMRPVSSSDSPVFLRSRNPSSGGEASPWIYLEEAIAWGLLHNNGANSFDITRSTGSLTYPIAFNVGGITNHVGVRFDAENGVVLAANYMSAGGYNMRAYSNWGSQYTGDGGGAAIANDNGIYDALMIVGNNSAGGVRVVKMWDNVIVNGNLSKVSGGFRIPHPHPDKADTHDLVHSFVEAPRADNVYRGRAQLSNGRAVVNVDEHSHMTDGTFVLLNMNTQCFTTNEDGPCRVWSFLDGNLLTIVAEHDDCEHHVSWLVFGERQDDQIRQSDFTGDDGHLLVEPEQRVMMEEL